MCGFFSIAFTFDNKGVYWFWADNKPVAGILVFATIILGAFWLKLSRQMKFENQNFKKPL